MDGQLTVYEHESVAFSRFLHNFLLPGPLCYADGMDSFITCNSSFEVECYKYQVLASSSGAEVKVDPARESELTAQKKVQVDWKFVLGEAALDIQVARFSRLAGGNGLDVLVLSEHMLLALSETGEIRTQIRLDFIPTALTVYQVRRPSHDYCPHTVLTR
jgi:Bardet-Biedl syndrome 9 protein